MIDSDITDLTAAADKVIKVGGPEPYLVNIEFQSSHDKELVETTWFRQAALYHRHKLPVLTVLVLLRREANSPSFTGSFEIRMRDGWQTNQYNYRVVRMWDEDPEPYLTSGINLVPLAPITNVTENELPGLVKRMAERINTEPQPSAAKLWTADVFAHGVTLLGRGDFTVTGGSAGHAGIDDVPGDSRGEGRVTGERRLLIRLGTEEIRKARRRDLGCHRGDSRCRAARGPRCANSGPGRARLEQLAGRTVTSRARRLRRWSTCGNQRRIRPFSERDASREDNGFWFAWEVR